MEQLLLNKVAIVTGAGGGLGRAHALELARHGARVVVNDVGSGAQDVARTIERAGGEALADNGDATSQDAMQAMVANALGRWGRVDILVCNAGILRDRSFAKMTLEDFRAVFEVHVMGAVHAIKAVWEPMRAQRHGRIVLTTSSSGLYGNFGQANYGAAKMALVGLMQTLALEGEKYGVRVNCLAPSAATRMTQGLLSEQALAQLEPAKVSPGLVALVGEDAPTRMVLLAGGGSFESAHVTMTQGVFVGDGPDAASRVRHALPTIADRGGETVPASGWEQYRRELAKAGIVLEDAAA
ncbi:SDR family NAD(P)-dependent oxidoreductase [Pseudorhodoferax sp.]|uniref:SDR family NAD(P)-dependent oxidoreductase n=1 Tax=Pseudorhodoferax sp. TaxID=1993553 RepID=UPI002DD6AC22|nr:SDR family NAD(P)-dependent oxidoreductase [Pseudorhodoferax sp.]